MPRLYTFTTLSRSCSSVWLERLPVTQEVAGSNPVSSAKKNKKALLCSAFLFFLHSIYKKQYLTLAPIRHDGFFPFLLLQYSVQQVPDKPPRLQSVVLPVYRNP